MNVSTIARVCHEANRALCEAYGDTSQMVWEDAAVWQRESAISSVMFKLENPDATAEDQHEAWCRDKIDGGWILGPEKDTIAKIHPCLVPYNELPIEQRYKDHSFVAIVNALKVFLPVKN